MNTMTLTTRRDDSWLPTAIALILSLVLHIVFFSGMLTSLQWRERHLTDLKKPVTDEHHQADEKTLEKPEENKSEDQDHLLLGKDDAKDILTLNWIGYEDFEKLIAMPAKTQQAALQRLSDPVKTTDAQIDPASDVKVLEQTTPQPQAMRQESVTPQPTVEPMPAQPAQPQEPVESPMEQEQPKAVAQASPQVDPAAVVPVVPVPVITPEMELPKTIAHEQPITVESPSVAMIPQTPTPAVPTPASNPEAALPKRVEPSPQVTPQENTDPAPQQQNHQESVAQPLKADQIAERPRPTIVPRQDSESQPYSLDHHEIEGKIGGVLVGKGIEIQTRIPRFSAVTQASIWPKANPIVEITFATDGVVITATIVRSSGYAGIDSPILTSVYHWKAKGELLKKVGRPFKRKFTFKLFDDEID